MKKILSVILLIAILFGIVPIVNASSADNVALVVDKSNVYIGDSVTVTFKISQTIQATDFNINYSSDILEFVNTTVNEEHYNVTEAGIIKVSTYETNGFDTFTFTFLTKAEGNATVSTDIEALYIDQVDNNILTFENKNINIIIKPIVDVTSVTLDKTNSNITVGETLNLVATVLPSDATNKTVTWKSSNTDVAIVSNGIVKAVKAGTAVITATAENKSATCNITVTAEDTYYIKNENFKLIQGNEVTMISGINEKTTIGELLSPNNFTSDYTIKAYQKDSIVTTGNVTTGTIIKIFNGSEKVKEYTVVIYGDTTGDGKIESIDALAIVKNNLNKFKFSNEVYLEAGRVMKNKRGTNAIPNAVDALACIKHKLGLSTISQY